MLVFLDERARRAEDLRWYRALEQLLALCDLLALSCEAARRFALAASAEQIEDRVARLELRRTA